MTYPCEDQPVELPYDPVESRHNDALPRIEDEPWGEADRYFPTFVDHDPEAAL